MNTICGCKYNCTLFAFIGSLIIGIISAFLSITAVITIPVTFLWALFGISVAYLAISLISSVFIGRCTECTGRNLSVVLASALGTVLFSAILLLFDIPATGVIGAIITGLLLFTFSLTLTSSACLAKCIACSED